MRKMLFALMLLASPILVHADATTTPANTSTSTPPVATSTPADTAQVEVRDGATLIGPFSVSLPDASSSPVSITATSATTSHDVPARSVLATLESLDATTSAFDITDLRYFSSFNSFFINCISIPVATSTPLCSDWQYVVNGFAPAVGVDKTTLKNNDVVILYFGFPRQVALSTSTISIGQSFTATAQNYSPANNTFSPATGVTIGVTQTNPSDPFTPLEIATSSADGSGQAIFTLHATGTYQVGIKEDFYFPTATLVVTNAATSTNNSTSTPQTPTPQTSVGNGPPVPTGGGGGGGISHTQLNIPAALAFLASKQHADGSFDTPLLSDWAAIAFAASDPGEPKTKLHAYLVSSSPVLQSATDYERHAMALEALGVDPYALPAQAGGTPMNYIAPIIAKFDGTQIGDPSLDNDDIFALFPLLAAGYTANDPVIQKTTRFIVSRQQQSGAWDASVDITAAAVQALTNVPSLPNVPAAITKAESYLHAGQQTGGGLGDSGQSSSFSTSWALQAIAAVGESASNWTSMNGYNPNDYLAGLQQSDGGVEPTSSDVDMRLWATEYAIPGAVGKAWSSLLSSFTKPSGATGGSSGSSGNTGQATTTLAAATSTPLVATSTTPVATTTPVISTTAPMLASAAANVNATSTLPAMPVKRKNVPTRTPVRIAVATPTPTISSPSAQIAAAALPDQNNFFSSVWQVIVSFFSSLF